MRKATKKALAIGLTALFLLSILSGCGAKASGSAPAAQPEQTVPRKSVEEVEEIEDDQDLVEDIYDDEEYIEEDDFEDEDFAEGDLEEGDFEEGDLGEGDEPAEGLSDMVLMKGYYGAWDGKTEYIFGVLSDKDFMINVVGASSPILYADGEYKDNGDGTFTATITETDNAFAEGQTLLIKAEGGPDISISSENPEVNNAAAHSYTYAGEKASDVESLK